MTEKGWITTERKGRKVVPTLTEKGLDVCNAFENLLITMEVKLIIKNETNI